MARLLLMRKNSAPKQIELSGERTLIGRDASNDLQIDHPQVSRHHVELRVEGATTWVIDLGSRNGTLVNGRRVKHWPLHHGDVVSIGDCSIRFLTRHTHFELPKELALAEQAARQ
ncbi:FOG: FHA domain [Variovorax sp. HW608]|uniref:FHA domain-containing protein n=1 Tax=Variovorax sp. HW608 TaxID=1034889 RepID=UPI00081FFAF1|nr:FHA domain-containing protein [Variovorax sp. HW608]SCK26333.1 FOG: FHA domain [Variovorax sp. HW608]